MIIVTSIVNTISIMVATGDFDVCLRYAPCHDRIEDTNSVRGTVMLCDKLFKAHLCVRYLQCLN